MDAKGGFSRAVGFQKNLARQQAAKGDDQLEKSIEAGHRRSVRHRGHWAMVDINKVLAQFTPGAELKPIPDMAKIEYRGRDYTVLADVGGGYLRILPRHWRYGRKFSFVDLNGENPWDEPDVDYEHYQRRTHFRIKKRHQMALERILEAAKNEQR